MVALDSPERSGALRTWLLPPFSVLIFLIHPLVALRDPAALLKDPGTGWHLATGRYILDTGTIPVREIFSYTAEGHAWINYYWLFDVIAARLVQLGGLPLYATACMLLYAALPVLLFRRMLRMGIGLAPAFVFVLVAHAILLSHSLARPHAITYVLFAILLDRLDRHQTGELPARSLWWLPLMSMLWCNMHGGFVAGLALTGIFAGVAGARFVVFREPAEGRRALVFGGVLAAMVLATFVNPSGVGLHLSILEHLRMESTGYFHEFRSPNFLSGGAAVAVFERLVLVLILLLGRRERGLTWVECALLAFFLDQALHSIRHINLFAIVAAPIVARETSSILDELVPAIQRRLRRIAGEQRQLKGDLVYVPIVCATFLGLALAGRIPFPTSLDDLQLSKGAADYIETHKDHFARMFNTDNMGGSLIYRFWPDLKVFVDDRIFVYGDEFVMKKYFPVFLTKREWHEILDEYGVTAAVVTSKTGCATLFRESSQWQLEFEDELTTIFVRKESTSTGFP